MKYIRFFEEHKYKGIDKENIEQDIRGILIELEDKHMKINIEWGSNTSPFLKSLRITILHIATVRYHTVLFGADMVKEYLLTVEDYIKSIWSSYGNIETEYEEFNDVEDTYELSDELNIDDEFSKVILNIKVYQ